MSRQMASAWHNPVLLSESMELLDPGRGGVFVDATFGGGGHSAEILGKLRNGKLFAFDKDQETMANRIADERFELLHSDFRFIEMRLEEKGCPEVNGIFADLGISSRHVDEARRGFSFRADGPLDMRMDSSQEMTAEDIVNTWSETDLAELFRRYGELRSSRKIAAAIVSARKSKPLDTTLKLANLLSGSVRTKETKKVLTLAFQALRIAVNDELSALGDLLNQSLRLLVPGGRLVIISYHSLEDRMVKHFMRVGNLAGEDRRDEYGRSLSPWKLVVRKAIKPSENEIAANPRSRSARLRAAEKI